jgi:DUF1680 family protein
MKNPYTGTEPENGVRQIMIRDPFWDPLREIIRSRAIPYQWLALNDALPGTEPSGCLRNFRIAAGKETGVHHGFVFQDSDASKWLEGVAYSLLSHPDPELERKADEAVETMIAAQQPDGYLNTYYTITAPDRRFTNLRDNHELYCLGHMIEAAVAYHRATGKTALLEAAERYADLADRTFGPEPEKKHGYPGHPEAELALIRLFAHTGNERYLRLARYFVDARGREPLYFREEERLNGNGRYYFADGPLGYAYCQADKPVLEQQEAEGHAVRAMYLYSAMADLARLTGDPGLRAACRRLWDSVTERRMYITGGIGSSPYGEAFTFDYDLPNDTAYAETCAAIGLVFFARRMLLLEPEGKYADVMERALYNCVLSGMQLDGQRFFYVNPLEVLPEACGRDNAKRHVQFRRQPWFGCACCPPNLVRLLMSLEDYLYSVSGSRVYIHLYLSSEAEFRLPGGTLRLDCRTEYPWDGRIRYSLHANAPLRVELALRLPAWSPRFSLLVNGEKAAYPSEKGYLILDRTWAEGDRIEMELELRPRLFAASPLVPEDAGKAAVVCGPLVYCAEEADNGAGLHRLSLDPSAEPVWDYHPEVPGNGKAVTVSGWRDRDWSGGGSALYRPWNGPDRERVGIRLIPYYAWANRSPGEMRVWLRMG